MRVIHSYPHTFCVYQNTVISTFLAIDHQSYPQ